MTTRDEVEELRALVESQRATERWMRLCRDHAFALGRPIARRDKRARP